MIGSFISRGLAMIFGYAYPAYECYKTVEKNKPEIEQLRFWCQYWILVACLTVFERIGDAFISWVPMYGEAKLAFFIYLWYPKTRGTTYVYDSFFRPYVAQHENDIDRNLLELRTRAGDMAVIYWQRAASYGQTRVFEILQYIAAQSTPRPRPPQQQRDPGARQPPNTPQRKPSPKQQPASDEPPSPTSSTSSSQQEENDDAVVEKPGPSNPKMTPPGTTSNSKNPKNDKKAENEDAGPENSSQSTTPSETESMQIETVSENENANPPPPEETIMEETIRVTRGRLRKTRSVETRQKEKV